MDWFRPAISSILLLGATLGLFFWAPLWAPLVGVLRAAGPVGLWGFTLARVALLLGLGFVLTRLAMRGTRVAPVALLVAGPSILVGGLMGAYAALAPAHLVIVLALAAALAGACFLGAARGARP